MKVDADEEMKLASTFVVYARPVPVKVSLKKGHEEKVFYEN